MFEKKTWVNRQSEHPARRRLTPTGNDNEYDVARAEGVIMEDGDAFDAETMNDLEKRVAEGFSTLDPADLGADVCVQVYACVKSGTVYELTGSGAVGRCKIPAAWNSGDTWSVNGKAVPAYCGADAVDSDCIVAGRWVLFTFDGQRLDFNGGGGLSSGKLAQATAAESDVLSGKKFYAGNKNLKTGRMVNNGRWPDAEKLTLEGSKIWMYQKQNGYLEGGLGIDASNLGNASPGHVLSGVSASSSNGLKFGGTMANRGAWTSTISPGSWVTVPAGYHNGSGWVQANNVGVSLAGTGYTTSASALNWSTTVSGANALLVIVYGSNMTKVNTPTVSSGTITRLSDCPWRQYNGDGTYGARQAAFVYAVTGISGNCTIRCTTSNWDWGFGATVYKIA